MLCVVQIQNGIEENLIVNYNASNPSSDENYVVNFFQSTVSNKCCFVCVMVFHPILLFLYSSNAVDSIMLLIGRN